MQLVTSVRAQSFVIRANITRNIFAWEVKEDERHQQQQTRQIKERERENIIFLLMQLFFFINFKCMIQLYKI